MGCRCRKCGDEGYLASLELRHNLNDALQVILFYDTGTIRINQDFIDHLADFDRFGRADMLFAKDKVIGASLTSLHAVPDLPKHVQERLYFIRFEDMMERPAACMSHIYAWLGLSPFEIDPDKLNVGVRESDSHYCMKYTHKQSARIVKPKPHDIPARIQTQIETAYAWYYQQFYPGKNAK